MNRLRQFFYQRHGIDELCVALAVFSVILNLVLTVCNLRRLLILAFLPLALCIWRMLSKNNAKRFAENQKFLQLLNKIKKWFLLQKNRWNDRKTHCYIRCKSCKNVLRLPKHKGEITVTCPVCKNKFDYKT